MTTPVPIYHQPPRRRWTLRGWAMRLTLWVELMIASVIVWTLVVA